MAEGTQSASPAREPVSWLTTTRSPFGLSPPKKPSTTASSLVTEAVRQGSTDHLEELYQQNAGWAEALEEYGKHEVVAKIAEIGHVIGRAFAAGSTQDALRTDNLALKCGPAFRVLLARNEPVR